MAEAGDRRRNGAIWLGLLLTVLGALSNGLYFLGFPAAAVVWISLLLPVLGLIFLLVGAGRAFRQPQVYRGRIWGSIAAGLAALVCAASILFFVVARRLPQPSAGAPQVGQRVPDFTLPDSDGHPVSLAEVLSGSTGGTPPKAVLLVFYRGYW